MSYILFGTAPGGQLLSFELIHSDVPTAGDYLAFDERAHDFSDSQGFFAYRVRQVVHWHVLGSRTSLVRAEPAASTIGTLHACWG